MKPTRTTRRLLKAAALGATVALGGLTATPPAAVAQQVSSAADQQFIFAYRLLQKGEADLAAEALEEFLTRYPGDARRGDALYFQATLARQAGNNQRVVTLLEDAPIPALLPNHAPDLLLGQAHYDLSQYDESIAALERIPLKPLDEPLRATVLVQRALAYRAAGNLAAAAAQLEQATPLQTPLRARALLELGRTRAALGENQAALEPLKQAAELGAGNVAAEAARLAGDLAYQGGDHDAAAAAYQQVITSHQSSDQFADAVVGLLWARLAQRQYPELISAYQQHQRALRSDQGALAGYLAAVAHQQTDAHDKALALLEAARPAAGDELAPKLLYRTAVSQQALGRFDAMAGTIDALLQNYPDSPLAIDARFLQARTSAEHGNPAAAVAQLSALIDAGEDQPYRDKALLQRARLHEQTDRAAAAIADYQALLGSVAQPDALRLSGRNIEPDAEQADAMLRLIHLLHTQSHHASVAQLAEVWLDQARLEPAARQQLLYRRALALVKLNKKQQALAAFDQLLKDHPQSEHLAESLYYRGLLRTTLGQGDAAVADLLAAGDQSQLPENLRAVALRLASVHQRQAGESAAAAEALSKAAQVAGPSALPAADLLWLGEYLLDQGRAERTLELVKPATESQSAGQEKAEAWYLTGRALRALGRHDAAVEALGQAQALGRGVGLRARLALAGTLAEADRVDAALGEYKGLIAARESAVAGRALYESGRLLRHRAQALAQRNEDAAAAEARDEARRRLKRVVLLYSFEQLEPVPLLAHLQLAQLAVESQNPEAARKQLGDLASTYPDHAAAPLAKAWDALLAGKPNEARYLLDQLSPEQLPAELRPWLTEIRKQLPN